MSDVLEPCVGQFHIVADIIMCTIMKTNLVMVNSHEYNLGDWLFIFVQLTVSSLGSQKCLWPNKKIIVFRYHHQRKRG